jgi:hypothetical protein
MAEDRRDWHELCAAVTKEQDPKKVLALVDELLAVFDERERSNSNGTAERRVLSIQPPTAREKAGR